MLLSNEYNPIERTQKLIILDTTANLRRRFKNCINWMCGKVEILDFDSVVLTHALVIRFDGGFRGQPVDYP